MNTFIRSLAASALLATLAACGGGGDTSSGTNAPATGSNPPSTGSNPPSTGGTPIQLVEGGTIRIDTVGGAPVVNTEDYVDATVTVLSATGETLLQASTRIRGRGNTTWGNPKKPYRLKFEDAAPMLGMPAERDWNLLANYSDKSLVRNKLAMTLGNQMGLTYSPRSTFAELYFNGEYQGLYEVFEHVETGPDRVNVENLRKNKDTDPGTITGGYLMEVDHRLDEEVCWETNLRVPICFKDPEYEVADITNPSHPSYVQYNYITSYLNAAEASLSDPNNSYENYFDVDAAVNYYLVQELMKNNDAQINSTSEVEHTSSVFLHKRRGGKLTFGPLWDFDIGAGNIDYNGNADPTGWFIRDGVWHSRLFENSDFGRRVFARWCSLKRNGTIDGLAEEVDTIVANIDRAAIDRNFERWDILGTYVWPNAFVGDTYEEEVDYLKTWITTRANWMNSAFTSEFGACPAN
jgi:hypothetical protein